MEVFSRLPLSVKPLVYHVELIPDLVACVFSGRVDIDVEVKEEVSEILLNSLDLKINECSYTSEGGSTITPQNIDLNTKKETMSISFKESIKIGKGRVYISFSGDLNDSMKGFYRTKYSIDGEDRYAAVTQFESTDARRAFPCWDEPAVKSKFNISIIAPKDRVVLSNMPEIRNDELEGEKKKITFDTTPIMSTYLVAFVVGEFDFIEQDTSDGRVKVRVFVPVGKQEQGKFALEMAVKTLPFYENWFGIEYPLPKADLIAIPDFASGAMENWGLITYRETALLIDPISSSASSKQWVALVVAHELAHQWFGNIVTMEWWTHLWLNEGFASWMEYLATDNCYPEWHMWKQFVYQDMGSAFSLDALKSSHPIEVPVSHPDEIDEIFDNISYSKGCTVIRMLYSFLGEESFKVGLNQYLIKHQYSNAFTEDLWEALAAASNKPVKEMMDTWTKQIGYPVVSVTSIEGSNKVKLEQCRFLAGEIPQGEDAELLWFIPVSIISDKYQDTPKLELFKDRTMEISIPEGSWMKLNADQTGFYRVRYVSQELRENIVTALQNNTISSVTDRLGIQSDAMALSRAGITPTIEALELMNAYRNETDYTVWADLSVNLSSIVKILLKCESTKGLVNSFGKQLYKKIANDIGWEIKESDSALTCQLRSLALRNLGLYGDESTIKIAEEKFKLFLKDSSTLSADLRGTVYTIVLKQGKEEDYESVLSIMRKTDFQEEKERCMRTLGNTSNPDLLQKTLEFSLSSEVRPQDSVSVINTVARNPKGSDLAWEFLVKNWDKLFGLYKGGFLLNSLISGVVSQFINEEKLISIISFFKEKSFSSRALDQAIETVRTNSTWISRDEKSIVDWLQQFQ